MIDWKKRGLELARVIDRHRKERMVIDKVLGWTIAQEMLRLEKLENKAQKKYVEWHRCEDNKKSNELYEEYIELIRKAG